ncbi:hypothetical protein H9P43_009303 [Blastocladiella emersonii ATCC 22665]|nr:hypothetical protein H9P43_009303 [Blastocladiella emersonii ATCC 22665]
MVANETGELRRIVNPVLISEVFILVGSNSFLTGARTKKWVKKELRFDGTLLVCLEDKKTPADGRLDIDPPNHVAAHVPFDQEPPSFEGAATLPGKRGFSLARGDLLVTPMISSPLLATPENWMQYWASVQAGNELMSSSGSYHLEDVDDDTPPPQTVPCKAKYYQLPIWTVPAAYILKLSAPLGDPAAVGAARRTARNPLIFTISTVHGRNYVVKTKSEAEFEMWTFVLHFAAQQRRAIGRTPAPPTGAAAAAPSGPTIVPPVPPRPAARSAHHPPTAAAAAATAGDALSTTTTVPKPFARPSAAAPGDTSSVDEGIDSACTLYPGNASAPPPHQPQPRQRVASDDSAAHGRPQLVPNRPLPRPPAAANAAPPTVTSPRPVRGGTPDPAAGRPHLVSVPPRADSDPSCLPSAARAAVMHGCLPLHHHHHASGSGPGGAPGNTDSMVLPAASRPVPSARVPAPTAKPELRHWAAVVPGSSANLRPPSGVPFKLFFPIFTEQLPTAPIPTRRRVRAPKPIRLPPPPKNQQRAVQVVPPHLVNAGARPPPPPAGRPVGGVPADSGVVDTSTNDPAMPPVVPRRRSAPNAPFAAAHPKRTSSLIGVDTQQPTAAASTRTAPNGTGPSIDSSSKTAAAAPLGYYPPRAESLRPPVLQPINTAVANAGPHGYPPPPGQRSAPAASGPRSAGAPQIPSASSGPSFTLGTLGLSSLNRRDSMMFLAMPLPVPGPQATGSALGSRMSVVGVNRRASMLFPNAPKVHEAMPPPPVPPLPRAIAAQAVEGDGVPRDSIHELLQQQAEEREPGDVSIWRMWQALGLNE